MDTLQRVRQWIETGKQVGKSFSFVRNEVVYRSSVAVQKWDAGYKLYIDEIEEEYIAGENYVREEVIYCLQLADIENLVQDTTPVKMDELAPLKGQKIFNPAFN